MADGGEGHPLDCGDNLDAGGRGSSLFGMYAPGPLGECFRFAGDAGANIGNGFDIFFFGLTVASYSAWKPPAWLVPGTGLLLLLLCFVVFIDLLFTRLMGTGLADPDPEWLFVCKLGEFDWALA